MILHIESSTQVCSVALSEKGKLVKHLEINSHEFVHGEQLTLLIDALFEAINGSIKDLSAVSVAIGPGSYTGLRIGLATAKGIAFGLKVPIMGISSLQSLIYLAKQQHLDSYFIAAFDAKRNEVYMRMESDNEILLYDQPVDLNDFDFTWPNHCVLVGDGNLKVAQTLKNAKFMLDSTCTPSALGQIQLAWDRWSCNSFDNIYELCPNYTKPCFIAERINKNS